MRCKVHHMKLGSCIPGVYRMSSSEGQSTGDSSPGLRPTSLCTLSDPPPCFHTVPFKAKPLASVLTWEKHRLFTGECYKVISARGLPFLSDNPLWTPDGLLCTCRLPSWPQGSPGTPVPLLFAGTVSPPTGMTRTQGRGMWGMEEVSIEAPRLLPCTQCLPKMPWERLGAVLFSRISTIFRQFLLLLYFYFVISNLKTLLMVIIFPVEGVLPWARTPLGALCVVSP